MNLEQLMFQLSLILFSVSCVFTVSLLIDRYPKIHRFGHSLDKHDLKVMAVSWPVLIGLMVLTLYSLFHYCEAIESEAVSGSEWIPHLLFPIIYFLLPPTIERVTTATVLLTARVDFQEYLDGRERETLIDKRFSKITKLRITQSIAYPTYMVIDSSVKYAMLFCAPVLYHVYGWWWWTILALLGWFGVGFVTEQLIPKKKTLGTYQN